MVKEKEATEQKEVILSVTRLQIATFRINLIILTSVVLHHISNTRRTKVSSKYLHSSANKSARATLR